MRSECADDGLSGLFHAAVLQAATGELLSLLRAVFSGQSPDGVCQWSVWVKEGSVLQHLQSFREGTVGWQE